MVSGARDNEVNGSTGGELQSKSRRGEACKTLSEWTESPAVFAGKFCPFLKETKLNIKRCN